MKNAICSTVKSLLTERIFGMMYYSADVHLNVKSNH